MNDSDQPTMSPLCPFLGSRRDAITLHSYPTESNVCHAQTSGKRTFLIFRKKRPYKRISLGEQNRVCLCFDEWPSCPSYMAQRRTET